MFENLIGTILPTDIIKIIVIACIVIVAIIYVCVLHILGKLWLQARLSGVPIEMMTLVGMKLRKVDLQTIVINLIVARKADLDLTREQLEVHYLSGGCVTDVIRAMIVLDRANLNPGWETLAKEDLQGINVLEDAQLTAERVRKESNNANEEYVEIDKTSEQNMNKQ